MSIVLWPAFVVGWVVICLCMFTRRALGLRPTMFPIPMTPRERAWAAMLKKGQR